MTTLSTRQQFADTMLSIGQHDSQLIVLVGDIGHHILQPFAKACPGRYYNIGICEPAMVGMAAGLSSVGYFPVVHTIAPFLLERSFEQIKLDFCYHQLGGNIVTVGSAFDYSNLGCTHHCYADFALLKTLQNTEITYPSSPVEFDALFKQSYDNKNVTLFRIPGANHEVQFEAKDIQLGKGIKITDGTNLTIVATGPQLKSAMNARENLKISGWDAEILYIHTIRPLDTELIAESVKKTRNVLVIEEHMRSGGLGDDVLRITKDISDCRHVSLAIPDRFITDYGSYEEHCASLGLTADGIVNCINQLSGRI